uniref:NADH-ubiquinone oxidoreductase chain 3 n=1 Tax=Asiotmethis zacharjini TaxID=286166 RepID=L7PBC2_9ORTH|nr:NADH dehydrogenase subunit 3 [Asiotmethis zacharjini]AFR34264.1 NADH dehydrogenase subunit 3 [Asiotmethis zacharjini]
MLTLSMWFMVSFLVPMLVMMLATILSKKMINDREKSFPLECGFDPKSSVGMPFSLGFFLIAVIFLIFDIEIALILPIVIILKSSNLMIWTSATLFFIMVLLGGLYHEWNQGALQWAE